MTLYLKLLHLIAGAPRKPIDPEFVEMLRKAGWRRFVVEVVK